VNEDIEDVEVDVIQDDKVEELSPPPVVEPEVTNVNNNALDDIEEEMADDQAVNEAENAGVPNEEEPPAEPIAAGNRSVRVPSSGFKLYAPEER